MPSKSGFRQRSPTPPILPQLLPRPEEGRPVRKKGRPKPEKNGDEESLGTREKLG